METQTNIDLKNSITGSFFSINNIIYIFTLALFLIYMYKKGIHTQLISQIKQLFLGKKVNNIENFNSLLFDEIPKDIVLTNNDELPIYKLGTALKGTYPQQMSILFRKSIYPVDIVETKGSLDNIIKLLKGELDIAFVDEELLLNFMNGEDDYINEYLEEQKIVYTKEQLKKITYLASLYYQPFFAITKQNSGILKWTDLKGKKIGVLSPLSNSNNHLYKLLTITDIEVGEEITVIEYDNQEDMINAFRNKLDAIYVTSNQKNASILNLSEELKLRFISPRIQDEARGLTEQELIKREERIRLRRDLFKKQFKFIFPKVLDLNYFYQNINMYSYLDTYASRMILIGRRDLDNNKVEYMIRNLIKNLENLQMDINQYQYNEKLNNVVGDAFQFNELASAPLELDIHSGAISVYEEHKLIKYEEQIEKTKIN